MLISIEFFGIPRARAGVEHTTATGTTLGEVLADLGRRFPDFAKSCLRGCEFQAGFTANLGGVRFTTNAETRLSPSETVLILSLDAGG